MSTHFAVNVCLRIDAITLKLTLFFFFITEFILSFKKYMVGHLPKSPYVTCVFPGPTLLFEKVSKGGEKGRRFYACSACRDRKDCHFFQWEDDKVSEARLLAREAENQSKRPPLTQQERVKRSEVNLQCVPDHRVFLNRV